MWRILFYSMLVTLVYTQYAAHRIQSTDMMKCSYGERGSLTATCVNATPSYFKTTLYRFDHLDETLRCLNCSLQILDSGTFDISGNRIRNLDLSYSKINTIRQRAFVGLIFLERLILANNEIKSIYPGTFTGVKKINFIDLENNTINVLSENGFLELFDLKQLNLRNNQIETIVQNAFNGLTSLEILDLSNNQINNITGVFDNLTKLEILYLNNNRISQLNGGDFKNLSSLFEIHLTNNFIKTIPGNEFFEMVNLRRLDLSNNQLDLLIPGSFHGLYNLEDLDLTFNQISEIPQRTLQSLHNLINLNISNNKVTIFQTGLYSGLPQLRMLNLSNNAIKSVEITGVLSLNSLHTLDFSNNNITDLDFRRLIARLPRIAYLNLEDNYLPCNLQEEMEKYFEQDNFKFVLFRNEIGSIKCIENPPKKHVEEPPLPLDSLKRVDYPSDNTTTIIWLFVLVFLILLLIGVLFYLQFRTFKQIQIYNMRRYRANSEVQLISSDLEARDNDSLKE